MGWFSRLFERQYRYYDEDHWHLALSVAEVDYVQALVTKQEYITQFAPEQKQLKAINEHILNKEQELSLLKAEYEAWVAAGSPTEEL